MLTEYWAHYYDDLFHQGKLDSEIETDDWEREVAEFMKDIGDDANDSWETVIDE